MSEPKYEPGELRVTDCPDCDGDGKRINPIANMTKVVINQADFEKCPLCQGSGKVFVIPARIIGPAREG